jgi:hypothetical protein
VREAHTRRSAPSAKRRFTHVLGHRVPLGKAMIGSRSLQPHDVPSLPMRQLAAGLEPDSTPPKGLAALERTGVVFFDGEPTGARVRANRRQAGHGTAVVTNSNMRRLKATVAAFQAPKRSDQANLFEYLDCLVYRPLAPVSIAMMAIPFPPKILNLGNRDRGSDRNSMAFAPQPHVGLAPERQNGGTKVVNVVPCRSWRQRKMHPEILILDFALDDVDIDVFHLPA